MPRIRPTRRKKLKRAGMRRTPVRPLRPSPKLKCNIVANVPVEIAEVERQRAQAEAAIAEAKISHDRLREAIDILPQGIVFLDAEGRYILWNKKYADIYKGSADLFEPGARVRISMDDFGTGYSSLSYLRSFPFDKIKIDQSFVRGLDTNRDAQAIIRSIASLGMGLGVTVTAEGVETEQELRCLRAEGCHEGQGFLFSRARPNEEIVGLLRAQSGADAALAQARVA